VHFRQKAVWGPNRILATIALVAVSFSLASNASAEGRHQRTAPKVRPGTGNAFVTHDKMDADVARRAAGPNRAETADVVVTVAEGDVLAKEFRRYISRDGELTVIPAYVLDKVPHWLLSRLANDSNTHGVHINRKARKHDALSSYAVNANAVDPGNGINAAYYSYTGAGVTVAFVDSGFTSYQDPDLADSRLLKFVDFVNGGTLPYDDSGHGTHVTGVVGGTGKLSGKKYAGIAPGTSIVSLKVLNANGEGSVGNIIKSLDWIYKNAARYNIRVVNMSVGASVSESYFTDPLAQATKVLVDMGITVVAAAGNNGTNAAGQLRWGGVAAPGNAPWVLTVCAFSTKGTYAQDDDAMADFSSAGPTAVDFVAKPDICAPGVGIVSMSAPGSDLYQDGQLASPSWLIPGTVANTYPYVPYESLTGTSLATPLVSGAVALMLQANPHLTPNLIKAILEYTAISKPGVSPLRQGAGFMNVSGALSLAVLEGTPVQITQTLSLPESWSKHIIWGNHLLTGGMITPTANAWKRGVEWGWAKAADGDNIVWGTARDGDNIVWGTAAGTDNIVWGTAGGDDNIVWGTAGGDDNIVWGTDCGGGDCDNIVWGTAVDGDNIVWGTAADGDNIVWGTAGGADNIVWGTANVANTVWPIFRGSK